jgi:hypothetical protein
MIGNRSSLAVTVLTADNRRAGGPQSVSLHCGASGWTALRQPNHHMESSNVCHGQEVRSSPSERR